VDCAEEAGVCSLVGEITMKLHDISMTIHNGMPVYKDKPEKKPHIRRTRTLEDGANESSITMDSHTGTHMDAFYHMLNNSKKIHEMPLEKCIGDAVVLDLTKIKGAITEDSLDAALKKTKINIDKNSIVLLKTRAKPMRSFDFKFTFLDKSGAVFLSKKGVKAVGIDQLGIERGQPNHETHDILFKRHIPVFEGLELSAIKPGKYFFIGLPLKIKDGDGAPVRAILIEKF
jgi:arylformamidase